MADGKRAVDSSKVWTTLITNTAYLPGLFTLDYSLKKQKSLYPLVALYTDTFPPEGITALQARGIPHQRIAYLLPTKSQKDYSADPRFYDCWSKLTPFSLTQYDRVVQLDSDMLVLKNMDELMDLELDPAPEKAGVKDDNNDNDNNNNSSSNRPKGKRVFAAGHACVCNPLKKKHYPADWIPSNCAFTHQHAHPDEAQLSGVVLPLPPLHPSQGGDSAPPPPPSPPTHLGYMNGGLQVVNPSTTLFREIVDHMDSNAASMDFADQSLLSDLYRERWVQLPYIYNALKTLRWEGVHKPIWRDEEVKNVHYILTPNPWEELDAEGVSSSGDEMHQWWAKVNRERKAAEKERGVVDDGF